MGETTLFFKPVQDGPMFSVGISRRAFKDNITNDWFIHE